MLKYITFIFVFFVICMDDIVSGYNDGYGGHHHEGYGGHHHEGYGGHHHEGYGGHHHEGYGGHHHHGYGGHPYHSPHRRYAHLRNYDALADPSGDSTSTNVGSPPSGHSPSVAEELDEEYGKYGVGINVDAHKLVDASKRGYTYAGEQYEAAKAALKRAYERGYEAAAVAANGTYDAAHTVYEHVPGVEFAGANKGHVKPQYRNKNIKRFSSFPGDYDEDYHSHHRPRHERRYYE